MDKRDVLDRGWQEAAVNIMPKASRLLARVATSFVGLVVLIAVTGLWLSGAQATYFHLLTDWGIVPFKFPFVDADGSLAAWECARKGVEVILADPCDILRRGYNYSPFWMTIDWIPLGRADRVGVGLVLGIAFLVSLSSLPPPLSPTEMGIRIAAALSTMVAFAIERANPDLLIFLLVILMLSLLRRSVVARTLGYCIAFFAGLIKYYPFILLGLLVRERFRVLLPIALASLIWLVFFFQIYAAEILEGLPNIAIGSPFGDMFGAKNFPLGMFFVFQQSMASAANAWEGALLATIPLFAATIWMMVKFWRASDVPAALNRLDEPRRLALLAGAFLMSGCFVVGQSAGYRGIFLLLVLPGLFALRRDKAAGAVASAARLASMGIAPLMWAEAIRHPIRMAAVAPPFGFGLLARGFEFVTWCTREVAWWFLIALLLSFLLGFIVDSPLSRAWRCNVPARRWA